MEVDANNIGKMPAGKSWTGRRSGNSISVFGGKMRDPSTAKPRERMTGEEIEKVYLTSDDPSLRRKFSARRVIAAAAGIKVSESSTPPTADDVAVAQRDLESLAPPPAAENPSEIESSQFVRPKEHADRRSVDPSSARVDRRARADSNGHERPTQRRREAIVLAAQARLPSLPICLVRLVPRKATYGQVRVVLSGRLERILPEREKAAERLARYDEEISGIRSFLEQVQGVPEDRRI